MSRTKLWSEFLKAFAKAIREPASARKNVVAWRDANGFNRLQLNEVYEAIKGSPRPPPITRLSLNLIDYQPSEEDARFLGMAPGDRFRSHAPKIEFAMLDEELLAFAEWLPIWIRGNLNPAVLIPLPPHPSHVFGKGLRSTEYAWTVRAWEADARWNKRDSKLPWYAIPAEKVTAA